MSITQSFRYNTRYLFILFFNIIPAAVFAELTIATYPANSVTDGNYCAAQLRLALFELKGADWYVDNVLFNDRVRTQLFILKYGSLAIGPETPHDYREGMFMVKTLKEAVDYLSEKNDTLFFPNDEWSIDNMSRECKSDSVYKKFIEGRTQAMYNVNGFIFSGHRTALFVEYNPFLLRRYNTPVNKLEFSYEASVMLWTVILQSPFAESSGDCSDYEKYMEYCKLNDLSPLPRTTNGLKRDRYGDKEISCYLEHAVGHDRHIVNIGTVEWHMEPITYKNELLKPVVRLKVMPDSLDCRDLNVRISENCHPAFHHSKE